MEDIAACMVKEVREIQPAGPYYLGGLCVGGLMAYEAARQILAQGQEVALLALFEPQTPVHFEARSKGFRLDLLGQRLRFHFRNLQLLEIREAPPYIRDRARTLKARVRRLAWHTVYDLQGRMNDRRLRNLGDIQHVAGRAYQPQPYTGRVALFQATNRPVGRDWDQQFGWRKLAARLEVHEIPGHHESFFLEPNVEGLADKLSRCLDEAQGGAEGQEDKDHETCRSEHS